MTNTCDYHKCPQCAGLAKSLGAIVAALAIETPLVVWASSVLHPLFDWLPHFTYKQALALSLLLAFATQVQVKGIRSRA
jgi:hypothetical protein